MNRSQLCFLIFPMLVGCSSNGLSVMSNVRNVVLCDGNEDTYKTDVYWIDSSKEPINAKYRKYALHGFESYFVDSQCHHLNLTYQLNNDPINGDVQFLYSEMDKNDSGPDSRADRVAVVKFNEFYGDHIVEFEMLVVDLLKFETLVDSKVQMDDDRIFHPKIARSLKRHVRNALDETFDYALKPH